MSDKRGTHPNSLANLNPVQPGECRNPGGRPKGTLYIGDCLHRLLDLTAGGLQAIADDENEKQARRVAARMLLDANDPDPRVRSKAAAELIDRLEGKAVARTELSGPDGGPLQAASNDTGLMELTRRIDRIIADN